jgi:hypothetical protein
MSKHGTAKRMTVRIYMLRIIARRIGFEGVLA